MIVKIVKYSKKSKRLRLRLIINGGIGMATQIAATPVIKGPEAIRIWEEAHRKPSKESKENAKKLAAFFEQETIKYDFKN